ncbi:hypothetical protein M0R45_024309 [Rubus argutus]|uniref:Late embryogenesis abundant protein LEA-2 subgroup domain-containing protein n=1 Tax=Rubus argutus TaxID=59490 RepID=A0AAW1WUN8_RUBAR
MLESERFQKLQKNRKCFAYIGIFIVFQIIVITIFALTVMKVKTPSVRLRSVTVESSSTSTATLIAEVAVKNKNFGSYKFDATTVNITNGDNPVVTANILKGKVGMKKTKTMNVDILLSSVSDTNITLKALSTMTGKVSLMGIMKKRKTSNMDCSMIVNVPNKAVYDLTCK